jgi:hypothetical protein
MQQLIQTETLDEATSNQSSHTHGSHEYPDASESMSVCFNSLDPKRIGGR